MSVVLSLGTLGASREALWAPPIIKFHQVAYSWRHSITYIKVNGEPSGRHMLLLPNWRKKLNSWESHSLFHYLSPDTAVRVLVLDSGNFKAALLSFDLCTEVEVSRINPKLQTCDEEKTRHESYYNVESREIGVLYAFWLGSVHGGILEPRIALLRLTCP